MSTFSTKVMVRGCFEHQFQTVKKFYNTEGFKSDFEVSWTKYQMICNCSKSS